MKGPPRDRPGIQDQRDLERPHGRPAPVRGPCSARGCSAFATERKPFCGEHLGFMAYVREKRAEIDGVHAELRLVSRRGGWAWVNTQGIVALDILKILEQKSLTPKRLRLQVDLASWGVELTPTEVDRAWANYMKALERAGVVRCLELGSRRGTPRHVVELVRDQARAA